MQPEPVRYVAPAPTYVAPTPQPTYVAPRPAPEPIYVAPAPAPAPVYPQTAYQDRSGFYAQVAGGVNQHATIGGNFITGGHSYGQEYHLGNKNYAVSGVVGYRAVGQGVGPNDHLRIGVEGQRLSNEVNGAQFGHYARAWNSDATLDAVYVRAEYAPDLGLGPIRPYVGVAAGVGALRPNGPVEGGFGPVAKAIAGVSAELSENVEAFAEYNYVRGPRFDLNVNNPVGRSRSRYESHVGMVGIRFNF